MLNPKKLKTDHNINPMATACDRQSFERFNDRLIKTIVYYLPLKSKINLICLNKRLKRCLSESQTDLTIDIKLGNEYNSVEDLAISDAELEVDEAIDECEEELNYFLNVNKQVLKHLLKTFNWIESINLSNTSLNMDTVLIICNNFCPNLKKFEFTDFKLSKESIAKLGQTYGQTLTKVIIQSSFDGNRSEFDKVLLNYCQNLTAIYCECIDTITKADETFLPKVDTISTFIKKKEDFSSLKVIADKYSKQLKSLTLFIQLDETTESDEELESISALTNLESLYLDFFDPQKNLLKLDQSLEKIAINCKQISSLRIDLNYCPNALMSSDLLKTLGLFSNLKKFWAQLLIIDVEERKDNKNDTNSVREASKFDISCLKECKKLVHLDLCLSEMGNEFFTNVDQVLPNLAYLKISSGEELSDATLSFLSRLKRLKALIISKSHFNKELFPSITDSGVESLFSGNQSIRCLVFMGQPNITQKSVDFLSSLAKENPTKSYRFECLYRSFEGSEEELMSKRVKTNSVDIPSNLFINISSIDINDDELFDEDSEEDENYDEDVDEELDEEEDFDEDQEGDYEVEL